MATEQENGLTEAQLEAFFSAGRAAPAELPEPLFARIMAGAEAEAAQPGSGAMVLAVPAGDPAPRPGVFGGWLAAVGGWPAMAGMASAAMAGFWFGFASPDALSGVIGFGADYTVGDFLPALSLAEGG